jgi:hypothetical protein
VSAADNFHKRHHRLKPPLSPNEEVVSALQEAVKDRDANVLMLGITPALRAVGKFIVAVDASSQMIDGVWKSNTDSQHAVHGDWMSLPKFDAPFMAVIGDGSLSFISLAEFPLFFAALAKAAPGARIAIRLFQAPEKHEMLAQVRDAAMTGKIHGFHALKWRVAMALADKKNGAIPVAQIHAGFEEAFPDRATLSSATGWPLDEIAEIDAYRNQDTIYHFATRTAFLAALPDRVISPHFVSSGTYELAERCPIFVADLAP